MQLTWREYFGKFQASLPLVYTGDMSQFSRVAVFRWLGLAAATCLWEGKWASGMATNRRVRFCFTVLVSISALFQTGLAPSRRKLFALTGVIWLLSIARELSWGRAFYTGIPPLKALWFGPYVYPSIAVIVLGSIVYFFAKGLHKELVLWLKQGILPLLDLVIVAVAMFIADMIEHHSSGLFGARTQLFEELGGLGAYCAVLGFMINVVFNKQFRTDQPLSIVKNKAM